MVDAISEMTQNGCFSDVWQVKIILQQMSHFINIEWVADLWLEEDEDGRVSDYSFLLHREYDGDCVLDYSFLLLREYVLHKDDDDRVSDYSFLLL